MKVDWDLEDGKVAEVIDQDKFVSKLIDLLHEELKISREDLELYYWHPQAMYREGFEWILKKEFELAEKLNVDVMIGQKKCKFNTIKDKIIKPFDPDVSFPNIVDLLMDITRCKMEVGYEVSASD